MNSFALYSRSLIPSSASSSLLMNWSSVFFICYFDPRLSDFCLVISYFFLSPSMFLLCSSSLLPTLVSTFMTTTLNPLLGKLLISTSFRFFWGLTLFFHLENIFVSLFCLTLYARFCVFKVKHLPLPTLKECPSFPRSWLSHETL